MPLCPLAAQTFPKPKDVSRHHPQESRFRVIMPVTKPLISLPMHPFGLQWERIKKPWSASKPLSDFLRLDLITSRGVACRVAYVSP